MCLMRRRSGGCRGEGRRVAAGLCPQIGRSSVLKLIPETDVNLYSLRNGRTATIDLHNRNSKRSTLFHGNVSMSQLLDLRVSNAMATCRSVNTFLRSFQPRTATSAFSCVLAPSRVATQWTVASSSSP
jgi:hypothetical protein